MQRATIHQPLQFMNCRFQGLCKDSDGDEYSPKRLLSARVHDFKLVVVTQLDSLPRQFTEQFYVIKVHVSQPM